jgi:DUF4097 and DUF4098 domain-containing protein YvlB
MTNGRQRRSSIFAGLLLILLGVIFLLDRYDPALGLGHLIRVYWPALLVIWGIAKLVDQLAARNAGEVRPPTLSGGEAVLLLILAIVLVVFGFRDWAREHFPDVDASMFGQPYSRTQTVNPQTISAGAHVTIEIPGGNITVHTAPGTDLSVNANETAHAGSESAADEELDHARVKVDRTADGYWIHTVETGRRGLVRVDLDVEVPKDVSVAATTRYGDIQIAGVTGNVEAGTDGGDVEIHNTGANVTASLQRGGARIDNVAGDVEVKGRGNEIEIADVAGNATVQGAFIDTIRVRNVAKVTRCISPWSDLTAAQVTGRVEVDSGDIALFDAAGPVKIVAHNKDIEVENVAGALEINDSHGDIKVAYSSQPRGDLNLTNDGGEVDLALPARSTFQMSALSRSGSVDSDFETPALRLANEGPDARLSGAFGEGGPRITIVTSYGAIHVRKSG